MKRVWILGAPDPEMQAIERLLADAGEWYIYATHGDNRVHPGVAYRADGIMGRDGEPVELPSGSEVIAVECGGPAIPDGARVVDHHRDGDPGFDGVPSRYFLASSLGQVCAILARGGVIGHLEEGNMYTVPVAPRGLGPRFEEQPNGRYALCHCGRVRRQSPASPDGMRPAGRSYETGETWRYWYVIPHEHLLVAAADHCLAAAYRGECPGVYPEALGRWRAESRAVFRGRPVEEVLAHVSRACDALLRAERISLGMSIVVRDMRPGHGGAPCAEHGEGCDGRQGGCWGNVPELPEAATRLGRCYIAIPRPGPDGRRKVVLGAASAYAVRRFVDAWGPANGLTGIYGVPERGFAGGYLK